MKYFIIISILILLSFKTFSQGCCSGGSGSPIAGGVSQGVLLKNQFEFATNFQHLNSSKFKTLEKDTVSLFDNLYSNYLYSRIAFGVSEKLTFSVESGYFLNKTQIGLNNSDTINSGGIGDLILFPRYQIYNKKASKTRTEIVLGLGYKIPLGKYNDSTMVYKNPTNGQEFYTTSPPTIQPSTGSQDFIFYGFFMKDFFKCKSQIKTFANILYIKKGWNPLGQKFGDYKSVGLFVSRSFYEKIGIMLQLKAESVSKMKYDKNVDMLALYNIDVTSTGTQKLFFIPQISFSHKNFTTFLLSEFPLYQFANGTQIVSQKQITMGFSYRFKLKKEDCKIETEKI